MDMAVEAPMVPMARFKRSGPGQPTLKTPEREQVILNAIARGYTKKMAAQYAGVSEDVLQLWQNRDGKFALEVEQARQASTIFHFEQAQAKAEHTRDWRWNDRVLQVIDRETWGKQETVTVEGGATITHALTDIDVSALASLAALLGSPKAIEGDFMEIESGDSHS